MSEIFSLSGHNIHATARAAVMDGLVQVAEKKNVPLDPALCEVLVEGVLERMDFSSIHQLSDLQEPGLVAMVREACGELDGLVLARMWRLVALFEGKDDVNDPAVHATARAIMDKCVASQPKQGVARWPDPMQLVADHYATVPRGPIAETRDDGTFTTYWLGRDLHRDPKEGPALHGVKDEKQGWEYWVKGELHRDHRDGPAIIYTHFRNFDLSGEEYFESGKLHRPSELGPAVTHWDHKGEPVMELYYENGQHHRDPSAGPAWRHIRDARTDRSAARPFTEMRYCVRGQLHRDEKDGPAWVKRDNETGVLLTEEYWRDGDLHREDGPAVITRWPEGTESYQAWWRGGRMRDASEGPCAMWHDPQGRPTGEEWCVGGGHERDASEGPGRIHCDLVTGEVRQEFFAGGDFRREPDGPAVVTLDRKGNVVEQAFWDGERMHAKYSEQMNAEAGADG